MVLKNKLSRSISSSEMGLAGLQLKEVGFCVIQDYVSKRICERLVEEVETLFKLRASEGKKTEPPRGAQKLIENDRTIGNIICHSKNFLQMSTTGDHLKILIPVLNDPFYGLIPSDEPNFILAQANMREGRSALPFHVDVRMLSLGGRTWSYQGQIALSDRVARTGGLRVVPTSHLKDEYPDYNSNYEDAIDVDLKAGDLILFSSQLHHATHSAASEETPGWAFNMTYRCWWAKQQYDYWNMLSVADLRDLSPSQQAILGGSSQVPSHPDASPSLRTGYLPPNYFE
jgi:hypothetical protein